MSEDVREIKHALENLNHTKELFKKDYNRYILSKNPENCELFSAWGFRCDKLVKTHCCERNLLLMILTGNDMVYS